MHIRIVFVRFVFEKILVVEVKLIENRQFWKKLISDRINRTHMNRYEHCKHNILILKKNY